MKKCTLKATIEREKCHPMCTDLGNWKIEKYWKLLINLLMHWSFTQWDGCPWTLWERAIKISSHKPHENKFHDNRKASTKGQ